MYDAIIIGARCAGSPLAMLLGRKGYKVLMVDKAVFPSDTISTHHIHQPGVRKLDEWGILDEIRKTNVPATSEITFDVGPFALKGIPTPAGPIVDSYAPRRRLLDTILARSAVEAGVEYRGGFTATELIWDRARVTGIRGRDKNGAIVTEKAKIVVGADGARSFVAKSVEAPITLDRGLLTCNYYSYFSGISVSGAELYPRDGNMFVLDATNDGLTLVVAVWKQSEFNRIRSNVETAFIEAFDKQAPRLAERVRSGRREEPFYGTGQIPNFIRRPYGPGWALVGDAGYHKDPITAQGITDSFTHAELLAEALDNGLSGEMNLNDSLAEYERKRNERIMPMFDYTTQLAELDTPPPEMQSMFAALHGNEEQTSRFFGTVTGTISPLDFYSPENIKEIVENTMVRLAA